MTAGRGKGAADPVVLGAIAGFGLVGTTAAAALQVLGSSGIGTGEIILIGFQVISIGGGIGLFNELRNERRERQAENEREQGAREKLAEMESEARTKLHGRFDDFLKERADEARAEGERFGEMKQKLVDLIGRNERVEDKVDSVGSKVAAQVQLHLDGTRDMVVSTLADFRQKLDDYDDVLKTLPRRRGA